MAKVTPFNSVNFKRTGGGVTWEQRDAQPSDFTDTTYGSFTHSEHGAITYAKFYGLAPSDFHIELSNWQAFADYFIMRRPVYNIKGSQTCSTKSFKADDIANYIEPGKVTLKNFKIPGGFQGGSIPDGKWLNMGMSWNDHGNTLTTVTVEYEQKLEWELVKIQSGDPPSPEG